MPFCRPGWRPVGEKVLVGAAVAALGIETVRAFRAGTFPPVPATYFWVAVAFSMLGLLALAQAQLAAALGIAVDVGLLLVAFGAVPEVAQAPRTAAQQQAAAGSA